MQHSARNSNIATRARAALLHYNTRLGGALSQRIARDEYPARGRRLMLPTELVIRRSCGCHAQTGQAVKNRTGTAPE